MFIAHTKIKWILWTFISFYLKEKYTQLLLEDADNIIFCFWGEADYLNLKPAINLFLATGCASHNLIWVQGPFLGWILSFLELMLFQDLPMMNCMTRKRMEVWKTLPAAIPWAD